MNEKDKRKEKRRWEINLDTRQREEEFKVEEEKASPWFLLSGALVSQELDGSTLPLTDSRPAV